MVGKCDTRLWRLICAAALLVATVATATAETVHGRSRELGIAFELTGGEDWCHPDVGIALSADKASVYQPEGEAFLKMVGRIRAIINTQCPSVERIYVIGHVEQKPVFAAEMSRLTRWHRFIPLDVNTKKPLCAPTGSECDKRIAAYLTMTQLMRGEAFADIEVTSVMEDRNDLQLAWTMRNAYGALKISHRSEFNNQYTTNAAFADANLPAIAEACKAAGGTSSRIPSADHGAALAQRSLLCRRPGNPNSLNIILVVSEGDWFYLFSLWATEPHMAAADEMAAQIVRVLTGKR